MTLRGSRAGLCGDGRLKAEAGKAMPTQTLDKVPLISIIDRDETISAAVENAVRSLGFDVRTFSSGEEFLLSPHRHDTACVISGVQMADMSGIELQQYLAAEGDTTPIMFITAFANERFRTQVMQAGAVSFLFKPFTATALIDGLQRALGKRTLTVH
jgi:FixJ family two-component response regulator